MSSTPEALNLPGLGARLFGLGSIFGKTLRESARSVAMVGLGFGLLVFFVSSLLASEFGTAQSRAEIAAQATQLPVVFRGLLGDPINVETMGGFISWRLLNIGPLMVGIWSLMALAGTIGGESARGSLEMLMTEPISRSRIALHKLAAHLVGMAIAVLLVAMLTWLGTVAFATLPGDDVPFLDTLAQMLWLGGMALAGGSGGLCPGSDSWPRRRCRGCCRLPGGRLHRQRLCGGGSAPERPEAAQPVRVDGRPPAHGGGQ